MVAATLPYQYHIRYGSRTALSLQDAQFQYRIDSNLLFGGGHFLSSSIGSGSEVCSPSASSPSEVSASLGRIAKVMYGPLGSACSCPRSSSSCTCVSTSDLCRSLAALLRITFAALFLRFLRVLRSSSPARQSFHNIIVSGGILAVVRCAKSRSPPESTPTIIFCTLSFGQSVW